MILSVNQEVCKAIFIIAIFCNNSFGTFFTLHITNKETHSSFLMLVIPITITFTSKGFVMNLVCDSNLAARTIASSLVIKNVQTLTGRNFIFQIIAGVNWMIFALGVSPSSTNTPASSQFVHSII